VRKFQEFRVFSAISGQVASGLLFAIIINLSKNSLSVPCKSSKIPVSLSSPTLLSSERRELWRNFILAKLMLEFPVNPSKIAFRTLSRIRERVASLSESGESLWELW
jgi:hypothetical protein